jgi:CPA1 family monovalent cation:H+ antiporter
MEDLDAFLSLMIIAAIVAIAVKYIRLPYTIALVITGLVLGFAGVELGVLLTPELIFLIFLPPLLFEAAITLDIRHLKENVRTIVVLAIPGVIVSTLIVGAIIHFLMGLPLELALLFGAMISPTDPVSVVALFKELGAPKKLTTIVEGESLFNDGTGIVLFAVMLLLIREGTFTILEGSFEFVKEVAGGLVVGGAFGYLAYHVLKPIDDHLIEVMITVILAFGAFLAADLIGVSGVIAVVVSGIIVGNYAASVSMSPTGRLNLRSFWEFAAFLVNSALFVLIGLEIHFILPGEVGLDMAVISALYGIIAILLARAIVVYGGLTALRRWGEKLPWSWKHVIFWGGLRGSIPAALALTLVGVTFIPEADANLLIVMTFGVVLFSLVVGGLTMKPLMNAWGFFPRKEIKDRYGCRIGTAISIEAAKKELEEMKVAGEISLPMYEALDSELDRELAETSEDIARLAEEHKWLKDEQMQNARKRLLIVRRVAITRARTSGTVSEASAEELVAVIDEEISKMR